MKKYVALFTDSAREFRSVHTLTVCGMLAALALVLGSFTLEIGNYIKIGFSGVPNELVDFMFGPVVGCIFSGALDILKFVIKPTGAFFPGFTLDAMLAGLIYGVLLYKKPVSLKRILAAKFLVAVLINILLGTLWLSMLYGKGFLVLLPARLYKNLFMWPVNSLVSYGILKAMEAAGLFRMVKTFSHLKGRQQER